MTEEQKFCGLLLKECIKLRDKRGKKLTLAYGLCGQLCHQSGGRLYLGRVMQLVRFFANQMGLEFLIWLPEVGKWTSTRRNLLLMMIDGLQNRKIRKKLVEELERLSTY